MSDQFWKRLSHISGLFAILALFGLTVFVANLEIKDLDLWLHIGVGKYIVQNGFHVPKVDILSCTIAGTTWVNHEWLFQIIVFQINRLFGPEGLINMQVVLVTITLTVLLILGYNKEKQLTTIFSLLLVSLVYHSRFTIRPDLYSLLFFALYILILSFYIDRKWSIYALFVIQLLWTNMHGFFFFGPLFALIGFLAEWTKRNVKLPYEWNEVGRLNDDEYKRIKIILAVVVLTCLINPMTFKGAWYPIGVFFQISGESKIFFEKIVELKRPISAGTLFSLDHYPFYKLLILLSFLSFVFNREKLDIGIFVFWLIFLGFSLAAIRNLIFFAFAAYLVFVTNAITLSFRDIVPLKVLDRKFMYLAQIIIKIFLAIWTVQYGMDRMLNGYFDFEKYERKSEFGGISLRNFPTKAVDFLVENDVKGNFFNDFNTGAYLVGRTFPNIKVFIDGRTEVYGPDFFKYYTSLWEKDKPKKFAKMLEKYQMTGALMNTVHSPSPKKVIKSLYENEEWVPVYFDYDALIFLKDVEQNKALIEKFRIDLANREATKIDLYRLGARNVTPYQNINRAYTLESIGLDDAALAEVQEALAVIPDYAAAYRILGKIYAKRKDYQKAFENFRLAVLMKPNDQRSRFNLAQAYYDLKEYGYAIQQYQKVIDRRPNSVKAYYQLSQTFVKNKQYESAVGALEIGFRLDPKKAEDIVTIGDLLFQDEQYKWARQVYQMGVKSNEKLKEAHFKLGLAYHHLGDAPQALEAFKKELQINPDPILKEKVGEMGYSL